MVATVVALCLASLLIGCGGGGDDSTSADSTNAAATSGDIEGLRIDGITKPQVYVPNGPIPRKLVVHELKEGSGPPVKVGDVVEVEYLGIKWSGRPFADSWTYLEAPVFRVGSILSKVENRRLEYGLDLGIRGMKAGGRREVIVPPDLLYWPDEEHGPLKPDSTVIFILDLLKIR